jgi:hypothetical protein
VVQCLIRLEFSIEMHPFQAELHVEVFYYDPCNQPTRVYFPCFFLARPRPKRQSSFRARTRLWNQLHDPEIRNPHGASVGFASVLATHALIVRDGKDEQFASSIHSPGAPESRQAPPAGELGTASRSGRFKIPG